MASEMHKHWMELAIAKSEENLSTENGGPFGAVIVKDNQLISSSANGVISNNDPTAHAEIRAIRKACSKLNTYDLSGCILYSSCEPCPMCLGAIYWARIDKVYYAADRYDAQKAGFDDDIIYRELNKAPQQRSLPLIPLDKEKAQAVFDKWKDLNPDIHY